MSKDTKPIFVQQRVYRLRRLADGARLLPLFGAALFFVPLLWNSEENSARTADVMIYLFSIWILLAIVAGILSRYLTDDQDDTADDRDQ